MLSLDARRGLAEVGQAAGLSPSATNERVRRLVTQGAIRRFTVDADPAAFGLPVLALIFVAVRHHADEAAFRAFVTAHPGIIECHHVTGPWSYLIHLRARDLSGVESFLTQMKETGFLDRSETMLALSSVKSAPFVPGVAE